MTTAEVFREVWEKGDYRRGSTAQRLVSFIAGIIPAGSMINDYGSGTGRADVELLKRGYRVNMVDIADNALEDEARALIGKGLTYMVCPLDRLPDAFPVAEWGICINVLMLVDPERLDAILAEIRRTCRNLIVEVYDMDDHRLGRNMTTMKGDAKWWADRLAEFWPDVESVKSPEHPRRYITICRS
jgi:SAM-dependent methyltransferase